MSKIDKISSAFTIVHTQNEIKKLEEKLFGVLGEVRGIQGPKGDKGVKGDKGDRGVKGDKGDPGLRGEKGERGEAGPRGERGADGQRGAQGDPGKDGKNGEVGPRGERGEQGVSGIAGKDGLKGEKGDVGPAGPQGDIGQKGEKGDKGDVGPPGEMGPRGLDGAPGKDGRPGDRGPQGLMGPKGDPGEPGPMGAQGEVGPQGEPGKDYREEFEEALKSFQERTSENQETINKNIDKQISMMKQSLSSLGGGGSYKLVDNADVDKSALKGVVDNAILIYDPTKKVFIADSFVNVLDRLKAELEVQYNRLIDVEGSYTYVGEALPGTGEGEAKWRIKRIEEIGDDFNILWADGDADFNNIWNDRTSFTYS